VPRHRARRPAENPGRRVRVTAAVAAARTALHDTRLEDTRLEDADAADTAPLPRLARISRSRAGQDKTRPPRGPDSGLSGVLRGAARGLVATPWFAAAAGFVLAAGLWMYSPHAQLKFPTALPGKVLCAQSGCTGPSAGGQGSLTVTTPGVPIVHHRKASARSRQNAGAAQARSAAAGLTFTFTLLGQRDGTFDAMIAVTGKPAAAHWQLAFELPTDTIKYVMGASWLPSSDHSGGIASPLTASSVPWGNGGQHGRDGQDGVMFMIVGTGSPVTPSGCFYNGASCSFTVGQPPQPGQR
jgi:hypothetical protein